MAQAVLRAVAAAPAAVRSTSAFTPSPTASLFAALPCSSTICSVTAPAFSPNMAFSAAVTSSWSKRCRLFILRSTVGLCWGGGGQESGVVWCGVVWRGVAWRGVVWCGVVWCGVVCGWVGRGSI